MKKAIKILGIVACAAVLFFNVSLSGKKNSNSIDLSSLTKINEANAECVWLSDSRHIGTCMNQYGWGVCIVGGGDMENPCDPTVQ